MPYDLKINFAQVDSPGNAPIGIRGFVPPSPITVPAKNPNPLTDDYAKAESAAFNFQLLGDVPYRYEIGQYEITAQQYVTFLNKVDPAGKNPIQPWTGTKLWVDQFSPVENPFSGQINYIVNAKDGDHYRLAAEFWRNKPLVNGNMFHLTYFANSLYNGSTLGVDRSVKASPLGFNVQTSTRYVELSTSILDGMYNLNDYIYPFFHRQSLYGYALPSQDEWIKSAYYSPQITSNGTNYFYFPTVSSSEPIALTTSSTNTDLATVDSLGRVITANLKPGSAYANTASSVLWQPPYAPDAATNANVVDVGGAGTPSPWLTYDQGGNVVEYTDTAVPVVAGAGNNPNNLPAFVKVHGGIANAGQYQLWLTSTGTSSPYGQDLGATNTQGGGRFSFVPDPVKDPLTGSSAGLQASRFFDALVGFAPVYRQDSLNTFDTFYTSDIKEAINVDKTLPYLFLGASFDQQITGPVKPVYRFFNQTSATHFYTVSEVEAKYVQGLSNYSYEGIGFKAFDPGVASVDFRRFYNSTTGAHAYSAAAADVEFFTTRGYIIEGIAWSAVL
ncbi:MAG: hypothetical protein EB070_10030 [Synechococcaceae bacterium WBA_2_066]|nr:hypothetical protein [Synechococcaceae bacterium WB5_2A_257]NBR44588.1 hypothetical protein [Synechococcaceae bacterium WB5_2B_268]NCU77359.1 hypothetical protein [Synechococcaceae bacterium WB7_1C_051]NCY15063.1 hypothetical protein [Synechococcaceae bacterium WB8_1A_041]NDE23068.1 hypothetical protein [Synechococcaceae bacterium WB9_3_282]NDE38853.1 hypothetical protein [Synechococcaceae bacterium WBA_2_066]